MEDGDPGVARGTEVPGLAAALLARREATQLTQARLAEEIGVHVITISNIERGKRMPSVAMLRRIAGGLDVSVDVLFAEADKIHAEAAKLHAASLRARKTGGMKTVG